MKAAMRQHQYASDALIVIPCWLTHQRGLDWARWWCADHRHWHTHGWSERDDGRRLAPCAGEIQLVPLGHANAHLLRLIWEGDAPPESNDPGPVVDPSNCRADLLLALRAIEKQIGWMPDDELLDRTINDLQCTLLHLEVWQYLHAETMGNVRSRDIDRTCTVIRVQGCDIETAARQVLPLLKKPLHACSATASGGRIDFNPDRASRIVHVNDAQARARREMLNLIHFVEAREPVDEFLRHSSFRLRFELLMLTAWREIHRTVGIARKQAIFLTHGEALHRGLTIGDAILAVLGGAPTPTDESVKISTSKGANDE